LDEQGTIDRVKARQGLISKIQNVLLGGYAVKEDLRELGKMLRDSYHDDLRELRHRWEKAYLEALESGQSSLGRGFKGVIQTLDRVMEQIHRGDYGYAGLMDRKGHIREDELARAFDYDKELAGEINRLGEAVEVVHSSVMGKDWEAVPDQLNSVRDVLQEVERSWREREKCFRSLEV
jgi:hypothetical protein